MKCEVGIIKKTKHYNNRKSNHIGDKVPKAKNFGQKKCKNYLK